MGDFFSLVGVKRIVLLALLVSLAGGFFFVDSFIFSPKLETIERDLGHYKKEIARFRKNLNALQDDFDNLGGQQDTFNLLQGKGFFSESAMRDSQDIFTQLAEGTGARVEFSMSARRDVVLKDIQAIDYRLVKSRVKLEISAFDDVDIYLYLDLLAEKMPGYLKLKNFSFQRRVEFSDRMLRSIFTGDHPDVIHANVEYDWYFMFPNNKKGGS